MGRESSPPSLGRRLWVVFLTGIPYGVFKIGGGVAAYEDIHPLVGLALIAWGGLDIILNLLSIPLPVQVAHCVLSNLGRGLDRRRGGTNLEQLALAVDTFAAFAIVSTMIWLGRIGGLPGIMARVWEACVIANILSVGVERIWRASQRGQLATDKS